MVRWREEGIVNPLPPQGPWIETRGGLQFHLADPRPESVKVGDIAWSLSLQCRYTGHTKAHYSVAQHSILASLMVPEQFALDALLHDAAEAYIGDVSSPLKSLLPEYKAIEFRIEQVIRRRFGLCNPLPPEVKHADLVLLATERRDVLDSRQDWEALVGVAPFPIWIAPYRPYNVQGFEEGTNPGAAYERFIERFEQITGVSVAEFDSVSCEEGLNLLRQPRAKGKS